MELHYTAQNLLRNPHQRNKTGLGSMSSNNFLQPGYTHAVGALASWGITEAAFRGYLGAHPLFAQIKCRVGNKTRRTTTGGEYYRSYNRMGTMREEGFLNFFKCQTEATKKPFHMEKLS